MSQRRFEQVESRPAADPNRTPSNVWTEVHNIRNGNRLERVAPQQEKTEAPKRQTDTPRTETEREAPRRRREPKTVDCNQQCPFKNVNSARSEMRGRESGAISKSDGQLLRNFDPSKGPMSDRLMNALQTLRKHAMDVGPDGKPLWTSYAPKDPAARLAFKDQLFSGNADYDDARLSMLSADSQMTKDVKAQHVRSYGEEFGLVGGSRFNVDAGPQYIEILPISSGSITNYDLRR